MKKLFSLLFISLVLFSCGNKKEKTQDVVTFPSAHPQWVYDATIYEVNVRQYTPEGTFEAFDSHLPRLKELGVGILWFMPIQPIGELERKGTLGSYYSIKNYTGVNPEFGSIDNFKKTVQQAHDSGMKVILDWVANHTSRDAKWITEGHKEWYVNDSLGNIVAPYDWTDVAKLNYENKEMRAEMIQSMLYWVREADIDGFRCDVAGEIPTDFWVEATDSLKSIKQDIFMLAEAEKPELNENAFDAFYAWDFHHKMNVVAQGKENADSIRVSLKRLTERFSPNAIPMYFTSNHDENSWNGTEFERMGDAAKTFAVISYMLPGMPLIYNGQEAGFNRRLQFFEKDSIDWKDKGDFTVFYKSLNTFRKSNPALFSQEKGGTFEEIPNNNPANVFSFKRVKDTNEVWCVFNLSKEKTTVSFEMDFPGKEFNVYPDNSPATSFKEIELKPWEYKIFFKK